MIFVDTSVWFAAFVKEDSEHAAADALLNARERPFLTTDYIIDELLTLFVARGHRQVAKNVGTMLWAESICKIVWVSPPTSLPHGKSLSRSRTRLGASPIVSATP